MPGWLVYRCACALVRLFYRAPAIEGSLPEGPCVIVGNHAQMNGPIISELYLPGECVTWCNSEMMELTKVPDYAFRDFWSQKPLYVRWLFRLFSYVIAPLSVCVFGNARCIPVYRDRRIFTTFRRTLEALEAGRRVVIFPERDPPRNEIVYEFQDRFIDLGRMVQRQSGEALCFVPMYVAPALGRVRFGEPMYYDASARPEAERERIREGLIAEITRVARSLPRHRVVPYRNMSRRDYPMSRSGEGATR